ncbi:phosphoribosylaminoimidazolesuccinocarboxamide synthase [Flavobacterium alkalisoli]|uniref:phosphoribosylaminoimidazolesuccinocarboxamide synthase n=1 Tax=Flavobacterium alkalisoli TaxID=2602769 RepID=UPI003A90B060
MEKKFKTKTGYCHILPDKIVLTRNGIIGELSNAVVGNSIVKPLIMYGLFLAYMVYKIVTLYNIGEQVQSMFHLAVAALLLFLIFKSISNSATPVIYRNTIKSVIFKKATLLTRAYFIVVFENDKGKTKKRLIMLPGSMTGGDEATGEALIIMNEEGLLTTNN